MAVLPKAFNSEGNKEGLGSFEAMPAGDYVVSIIKSEMKETAAKNGNYLMLQMKVIAGEFKGRMIFENLNLDNPNPTAVEIAYKTLNSICQAVGKVGVQDSQELHGIPFVTRLKVVPKTPQYPASNSCTGFKKYEGEAIAEEAAPAAGSAPSETPEAPAQVTKKLPWE